MEPDAQLLRTESVSDSLGAVHIPPLFLKVWPLYLAVWAKARGRFLAGSCLPCLDSQQVISDNPPPPEN